MFQRFLTLSNLLHTHSTPNTTPATYTALAVFEHYPASTKTFSPSLRSCFMHICWVFVCMPAWRTERQRVTATSLSRIETQRCTVLSISSIQGGIVKWRTTLIPGSWYTGATILHHQNGEGWGVGVVLGIGQHHTVRLFCLGNESNL